MADLGGYGAGMDARPSLRTSSLHSAAHRCHRDDRYGHQRDLNRCHHKHARSRGRGREVRDGGGTLWPMLGFMGLREEVGAVACCCLFRWVNRYFALIGGTEA
jgi:hypothetical protein